MSNDTIKFSYNWNNKLENKAFTTIRLHNDKKYIIGKTYEIELNTKPKGKAILKDKRTLKLNQLNDFISYIDTGYSVEETTQIIKRMYKNIDLANTLFDFCLLVYVQKPEQKDKTPK